MASKIVPRALGKSLQKDEVQRVERGYAIVC